MRYGQELLEEARLFKFRETLIARGAVGLRPERLLSLIRVMAGPSDCERGFPG